jgi:hypothetical protein
VFLAISKKWELLPARSSTSSGLPISPVGGNRMGWSYVA